MSVGWASENSRGVVASDDYVAPGETDDAVDSPGEMYSAGD